MDITGKITKILEKVTGQKKDGSGTWVKQSFVVETNEKYNNLYFFELFGEDKVDKFNQYNKVGSEVKVDFNISTNEWKGKYFTSLQCWKVFKADAPQQQNAPIDATRKSVDELAESIANDEEDDLPFK